MSDRDDKPLRKPRPAHPVPRPGLVNVDDTIEETAHRALEEARRREEADKRRRDST